MKIQPILPDAVAQIRGGGNAPRLYGKCKFYQKSNGVWAVIHVYNLPYSPTGFFALHIHEGSSCGGENFAQTGGHFNPDQNLHPNHAGDLPPLLSCDGEAHFAVLTNRFRIKDILGRTIVIHSDPDDFHTQPAGNAGTKIACGVIHRG